MTQYWIAIGIVLAATAFLCRSGFRSLFGGGKTCGSSCGGCGNSTVVAERTSSNRISLPQV